MVFRLRLGRQVWVTDETGSGAAVVSGGHVGHGNMCRLGGRRGWLPQSCLRPLPKPVIVGLVLRLACVARGVCLCCRRGLTQVGLRCQVAIDGHSGRLYTQRTEEAEVRVL